MTSIEENERIENERIIAVARLGVRLWNDDLTVSAEYRAEMEKLGKDDPRYGLLLETLAMKLLNGNSYRVISGDPVTIARARSIAKQIGATERTGAGPSEWQDYLIGTTEVVFDPPTTSTSAGEDTSP
jgi:hypothetical protein